MYHLTDLVDSEIATVELTRKGDLKGAALTFPQIVEMLLLIPQVVDRSNDQADLAEHTFYYFAHYLQSHATANCILNCFERGYYLEATILTRHMIEAFIQMRFFRKYPEKLDAHITQEHRIRFHTMFEEFSPGYYSKYYGQFLSEAAHGMAHKMIMRTYREFEQDGGNLVIGNWYNEKAAITVINALAAVVSGYFNYVDIFLPRNQLNAEPAVLARFLGLKTWLNNALSILVDSGTEPKDLYEHYKRLFAQS